MDEHDYEMVGIYSSKEKAENALLEETERYNSIVGDFTGETYVDEYSIDERV